MTEDELLQTACEQFLGKDRRDIENTILQTMEGHLRAILGTLSVEAIYQVRKFGLIKVFIHFRANATTATLKLLWYAVSKVLRRCKQTRKHKYYRIL